jgi:uracil-DNA glycosylase
MTPEATERLRAYVDYLRDLGVYDLYRRGEPRPEFAHLLRAPQAPQPAVTARAVTPARPLPPLARADVPKSQGPPSLSPFAAAQQKANVPAPKATLPAAPPELSPAFAPPDMPLISFNARAELPQNRALPEDKPAALQSIRHHIGDCTRCPLAYAGRRNIVFADGNPNARLMFVGEGPGADEDASGIPFVGKAGQLLNNMITAMGLKREDVYIANIVKCRPPGNRNPEPVEANTCSQFLVDQIDIVQPQIIVALGAIAATYLLGVKKPLVALRGQWHDVRGSKTAVTYHPAYLLRDPSMKGEAWKDLQRVMVEMGLKS